MTSLWFGAGGQVDGNAPADAAGGSLKLLDGKTQPRGEGSDLVIGMYPKAGDEDSSLDTSPS
ncbi:hypothetical protein [[Phormidium] sp. ETS-05]|uniref:hypothetical protein n=1 Tax=[Phormidium] sp. ETS-05 TaxID=222819 RepID=UPI0018EEE1B0|nr:hypothetical protein [[Phormidium] sp. ETS-05]